MLIHLPSTFILGYVRAKMIVHAFQCWVHCKTIGSEIKIQTKNQTVQDQDRDQDPQLKIKIRISEIKIRYVKDLDQDHETTLNYEFKKKGKKRKQNIYPTTIQIYWILSA